METKYQVFLTSRDVVEDLSRSGRPSTSSPEVNIAQVKEKLSGEYYLSVMKCLREQIR